MCVTDCWFCDTLFRNWIYNLPFYGLHDVFFMLICAKQMFINLRLFRKKDDVVKVKKERFFSIFHASRPVWGQHQINREFRQKRWREKKIRRIVWVQASSKIKERFCIQFVVKFVNSNVIQLNFWNLFRKFPGVFINFVINLYVDFLVFYQQAYLHVSWRFQVSWAWLLRLEIELRTQNNAFVRLFHNILFEWDFFDK